MKHCKTKILSVLLVLVMVLGIIPVASMTASADDGYNYTADSWYSLDMYLKAAGTCTIKLTDNIKLEYEPETEGHETLNIYGNKTIDLNGYKIECTDSSGIKYDEGKEVSVESEKLCLTFTKVLLLQSTIPRAAVRLLSRASMSKSLNIIFITPREMFSALTAHLL